MGVENIRLNLKKLGIFIIFAVFIVGICVTSVDASSFSCKSSKIKHVGEDEIQVLVSNKVPSENGRSVRVICRPSDNYVDGPAHHKLDKLTVKYKVGKKVHKKTKKLKYDNDYFIGMPKGFKIVKITVKYHKASYNEYNKLVSHCWWLWG